MESDITGARLNLIPLLDGHSSIEQQENIFFFLKSWKLIKVQKLNKMSGKQGKDANYQNSLKIVKMGKPPKYGQVHHGPCQMFGNA